MPTAVAGLGFAKGCADGENGRASRERSRARPLLGAAADLAAFTTAAVATPTVISFAKPSKGLGFGGNVGTGGRLTCGVVVIFGMGCAGSGSGILKPCSPLRAPGTLPLVGIPGGS